MYCSAAQAVFLLAWATAALEGWATSEGADSTGFVQTLLQVERADADRDFHASALWSPGAAESNRSLPENATMDALSMVKTLTTLVSVPVDVVSTLASTPLEVVELGGPVLVAKARVAGKGLAEAVSGSVREIEDGNMTAALRVAGQAFTHTEDEERSLDKTTSGAASTSYGILIVFGLVILSWVMEFCFTTRYNPSATESMAEAPQAHFLNAFGFMRFLMAWHVVVFNFYAKGNMSVPIWLDFSQWGEIAVPWFFVLSGFVNSYWKFVGPKADMQEDLVWGMIRRVSRWYPLFVISLLWCALRSMSIAADDWNHFLSSMLLINGMWFDPAQGYFPWVCGDWWLCFLMVYLLSFTPMHNVLMNSGAGVIWTLFTISFLIVIPSTIFEWFFMDRTGWFIMVQYWPSFVFGQALAVWFVRICMQQRGPSDAELVYMMRPVHEIPPLVRFGATLSTLILGIMYFLFSPQAQIPWIHKSIQPILFKGGLLPMLGLQIVSFASEVDPLAKLFARKPFRWGDRLALTTFIFQVPIHNTIEDLTDWKGMSWTFAAVLFVLSVLFYYGLDRPWCQLLKTRVK